MRIRQFTTRKHEKVGPLKPSKVAVFDVRVHPDRVTDFIALIPKQRN